MTKQELIELDNDFNAMYDKLQKFRESTWGVGEEVSALLDSMSKVGGKVRQEIGWIVVTEARNVSKINEP